MSKTSLNLFDLAPGKVIADRYEILRPHRQGGMSATFEVKDKETGDRCELQAFPVGLFEGPEQGAEFAERLAPWTEFESDSVLKLRELLSLADGSVLFLTDFPEGQSLRSWLGEHTRMGVEEAVGLVRSLLEGLVELHAADLVHGDIKPATTFFRAGEMRGVLVDGGITPGLWAAKHLGARTALIGTPYYAPLEQFTGDSPDALSDIYAVSTVLYELLAGALPWTGTSYIEVFQSKMQESVPKMSHRVPGVEVPSELEAVIADGLRAKRRDRIDSARELLDRLSAVQIA